MAQTNIKSKIRMDAGKTHEGARAMVEDPIAALRRVLNAHLLWEDTFYMDGKSNADVLTEAVARAVAHDPLETGRAIIAARKVHNIRHAPLMAAVTYAKLKGPDARDLLTCVISRADEMAEVLAMGGGGKAPHAVVKAVRDVLEGGVFDEYQLGKYKGEGRAVTLRDAVFISHANPEKNPLIQKIVDETLEVPNTWETRLSAGGDKREVFTELLVDNRLGAMALLRNLRNMDDAGVSFGLIAQNLATADWSKVLPFRFLTAALTAPRFSVQLDKAFQKAVWASDPLPGRTAVLLDTSGSMTGTVSNKSIVKAYQAGAALAAAVNGDADLYEWADTCRPVNNWQSLSTALGIANGSVGHGTNIGQALSYAHARGNYDRMIVITDMQFNDKRLPALSGGIKGYTINLSPYAPAGLMVGNWTHLTGFSAATLKWIAQMEAM